MNHSQQKADAEAQAAVWQARLSSDLITDREKRDFERWLAVRPENRQAWQEINAFWRSLDGLDKADIAGEIKGPVTEREAETRSAGDGVSTAQRALRAPVYPEKKSPVKRRVSSPVWAIAATVLLSVSLVYTLTGPWFADYQTTSGELQSIRLADGSQIILNSESALSVDYTPKQRGVTLHRGEAYFDVAADAGRPFVVTARSGQITALGTEFDIKNRSDQVAVTVFEHAVSVALDNGKVTEYLPAGQQVVFGKRTIEAPTVANLPRLRSWRDGQMIFHEKALADVIAELGYYRSGLIIILGDDLKKLPVTGIFDTADTNIALKTIEQSLPLKVHKITDKLVLISAK